MGKAMEMAAGRAGGHTHGGEGARPWDDPEFAAAMEWLSLSGGARGRLDTLPGARFGNALAEARSDARAARKGELMGAALAMEGPAARGEAAYRGLLVLAGGLAEGYVGFGEDDENLALGGEAPVAPKAGIHPCCSGVFRGLVEMRARLPSEPSRRKVLGIVEGLLGMEVEGAREAGVDPLFAPAPGLPTLAELATRIEEQVELGDALARASASPSQEPRFLKAELAELLAPWRAALESRSIAEAMGPRLSLGCQAKASPRRL